MWYKAISKCLGINQSTARQIVYKWRHFSTVATLPRSMHPAKMTTKSQRRILNEVKKNPQATAKDLRTSLELANIHVHKNTIYTFLNRQGVNIRILGKKPPALQKKYIVACLNFTKEHLGKWQGYWANVFVGQKGNAYQHILNTSSQ